MDISTAEFWTALVLVWVLGLGLGFLFGRVFRTEREIEPLIPVTPEQRRAFEESRRKSAQRRPPVTLHRMPYDHRREAGDDPA